jgi:peptidyl-prolyl cis-trans isomerase D
MLDRFWKGVTRVFIVALFSILILSFALWGIPQYNREVGNQTVATVGSKAIGAQELQQVVERQRTVLGQEMGGQVLTREQARVVWKLRNRNMAADLDRDALNALIERAAIEKHAEDLGLALSDQAIAEAIRNDPLFQGPDKQFSRALFNDRMQSAGYTERRYFNERRAEHLGDKVAGSLRDGVVAPASLVSILHKWREETRRVAWFTVDPSKVPKVGEPDEAKLKEHYERVKTRFNEPERRRVAALLLTRDDLKKLAPIEDAEVKATWEKDRARHDQPERRRWQQIAFKTRGEAEAAAKELAGGKSFLVLALEVAGMQGRTDQGLVARRELSDTRLGNAVFAMKEGQTSDPIEVRAGFVIARLIEIVPARERPFDEVAAEIRNELEQNKHREITQKLSDQIEDLRAQRKPLKEIAAETKLRFVEAPSIDRTGKAADGKPGLEVAEAERILTAAFEPDRSSSERDTVELSDGQAWLEVTDIVPARQKPFETVAAEVKTLWIEEETRKAIAAYTDALVERIRKGETIEDVAKAEGAKLETTEPFKRNQPVTGLATSAVRAAFTMPVGGVAASDTPDGKSRNVAVVREIKPAAEPTQEQTDRIRQELRFQLQSDTVALYTAAVRQRFPVQIDEAIYRRAIGADQQQQ